MRVRPTRSARSPKPQYFVAAVVPALIVVLSITGFVWAQKKVTVVVDGRALEMKTQASDVAALLREAKVVVDAADVVTPALDSVLDSGDMVVVRHSVPVTLDLNGSRVPMDVVGETVADALVSAGADPGSNPDVTPASTERLEPGMTISVPDVFVRVTSREVTVATPVEYLKDASLPKGERRVVTTGSAGRKLQVFRMLVTNGREGTPVLSTEHTVEEPEARVVAVGTAREDATAPGASADAEAPETGKRMRVEATGYSAAQPDLNDITATGAKAVRGVIAVDPRVIPLGTRVYVPGYGYAVAADTGGAIKGRRIDLCFDTVEECFQWGRRTVTIIILD
jgi:3D (Asp-Asp-Asp) domain-containing protein